MHAPQEPVVGGRLLRRPAGLLERIECVGVVLGHDLKYGKFAREGDGSRFMEPANTTRSSSGSSDPRVTHAPRSLYPCGI